MEKEVDTSGRNCTPDMTSRRWPLREVTICCKQCRKSFRLVYTEIGNPHIVAFRNVEFTCARCKRKRYIEAITEGKLLKHVTVWNSVYI
ncbi:hypothetical protein [Butyrivibrio sp.]|uniref:hypothetical protein n=1 Tax=Butyrivibrio sp. TaxID=28121 RepID=UPI0025C448E7|nr:hypothetical protein [Butyrivibrio sp.]MBQ6416155.1 hypothetical protein [Butyrivibrio sp.]MBQ9302795.1 hypothetical protein [Butyrivibrio sp.]